MSQVVFLGFRPLKFLAQSHSALGQLWEGRRKDAIAPSKECHLIFFLSP